MSNKVLVTGGLGYIGSHTVLELISAGYEPIILDNLENTRSWILDQLEDISGRKITFYKGDIRSIADLESLFEKEAGIGALIHFAAYKAVGESVDNPLSYYDNNVGGLNNVLKMVEKYQVKHFVFSSSCTVYGNPKQLPVDEHTELQWPESPYGKTKRFGEEILADFQKAHTDLRVSILRYFNPIGAHPSGKIGELPMGIPNNLVPYIAKVAEGKLAQLTVFGDDYPSEDGTCIRDYIHVVDLAKAHVAALKMNEANYEVYNVGVGQGSSVLDCIKAYEEANKVTIPFEIGPRRAGDAEVIYAKSDKIKSSLGWQVKYSLQEAMQHVHQWHAYLKENNISL